MIETIPYKVKQFPILRFSLMMGLIISFLFQIIVSVVMKEDSFPAFLRDLLITMAEGVLFNLLVYYCVQFSNRFAQPLHFFRYPLEIALLLLIGFYFLYMAHLFKKGIYIPLDSLLKLGSYRLYICINLVGLLFFYLMISAFYIYRQYLEKSERANQLQKDYAQIRLQVLKSQVNPHFLFNSLSVLSSLVHADAEASEKFILQLSKAYRYILDQKDTTLVTVKEELDFLDAYFYLLKVRFGEKIRLEKNIELDASRYQVPPLTLQLLVENAVKHNSISNSQPLLITVTAAGQSIEVGNNINRREQHETSTGIGLDNIRKRIAFVSHKPLSIHQEETRFLVTVPLIALTNQ